MSRWKGKRRFYNGTERWSNRMLDGNWLPKITEYNEEDENGRKKQSYVLIDDLPSDYAWEFTQWAGNKVKQVSRLTEKDGDVTTTDEIVYCVERRIWERWFRKKMINPPT